MNRTLTFAEIVSVLIISLYRERFYVRSAKFSSLYKEYRYIEDRYIGVLSHKFTVTFAGTWNIHRNTGNIVISRIVIYRGASKLVSKS